MTRFRRFVRPVPSAAAAVLLACSAGATARVSDLVVLEGDLAADASVIRAVRIVFKNGVGYDPSKLIESTKGRVGVS